MQPELFKGHIILDCPANQPNVETFPAAAVNTLLDYTQLGRYSLRRVLKLFLSHPAASPARSILLSPFREIHGRTFLLV
jgi:hypothetical protein